MTGFGNVVAVLGKKGALKKEVEAMAFKHLDLEVTTARLEFFRDTMIEVLDERLGTEMFSINARVGMMCLINYAGSAFIYVRREYAGRIKIILNSWAVVQKSNAPEAQEDGVAAEGEGGEETGEEVQVEEAIVEESNVKEGTGTAGRESGEKEGGGKEMKVPTTFNEMLLFNASVMGYGGSSWMNIVLQQFDDMVKNVANFNRMQEESDVMSLVLAKYKGRIELSEFKAVTLASLRSLLPQQWDSEHEVAWCWLWENIETLLSNMLGKTRLQEDALDKFYSTRISEENAIALRKALFPYFLEQVTTAQSFLKQSATRINFVADKIICLTLELYRRPKKTVEDLSSIGLRHVGYGVPSEMMPPFVSSSVGLIQTYVDDQQTIEGFRWAMALMAKILMRTITEGSTLVMKAINSNQKFQLKKAMEVIPRGHRAKELLNITVGTQSISPFYWAIDSGALVCAQSILEDILTIRADRDVYYYGCEALFTCHPECVQRLCGRAPTLLPTLLDGLVWRSRQTVEGMRRTNYYVKHFIQDLQGGMSQNLVWFVEYGDPQIVCHPTVVVFSDMLWTRLASRRFILSKIYYVLTLVVFITGQAALFRHTSEQSEVENIVMFSCRVFNYLGSMCKLFLGHCGKLFADIRAQQIKSVWGVPVPAYLFDLQELASLLLLLLLELMCMQEPYLWCLSKGQGIAMTCKQGQERMDAYSLCSFLAMMLYWGLLSDLAIFSMRISAYVLVCGRVAAEVGLFFTALFALILAFSTSISALYTELPTREGAAVWMEETLCRCPCRCILPNPSSSSWPTR
ncbi:unnamed protein product [Effrenium voratum]|uniref:Globin family profile domain-containing protein n=1 Tax=Effrenium voratum TaxID=2562239 RepID=A0AA36J5V6_9DINO|nr:unnamed protein product [Effrenium voratum]